MLSATNDDCHIIHVPPPRNGRTKYWCVSHDASATARFGGRMPTCEGAYRTTSALRTFTLNPDAFPGGVALWGAVEPVYNSTLFTPERGIHVHARSQAVGRKDIDQTFDAVALPVRANLLHEETVVITGGTAVAYYLSRFLERPLTTLFCPFCNTPHLDSDWFAVKPHRTHLCHGCIRLFKQDSREVSNPLEAVRYKFGDRDAARKPRRAKRPLDIRQADYPGGLQIWASNPALLWTSSRSEEEGIHVHGWKGSRSRPELDSTFDTVRIDGIDLDERQLRHYMAQHTLIYLKNKIVSLRCPACNTAQFDENDRGFIPRKEHDCGQCGSSFPTPGSRQLVVSNPFVETLDALNKARLAGGRA